MRVRSTTERDRPFVVEMARLACSFEDRPLPSGDDREVLDVLPGPSGPAVLVEDDAGEPLGAAWCFFHDPPLLKDAGGRPLPELAMAVVEAARGRGIGTALIEALAVEAAATFDQLSLNVHICNRAARLYTRTGFRVAAAGRGWFGVAMSRNLRDHC